MGNSDRKTAESTPKGAEARALPPRRATGKVKASIQKGVLRKKRGRKTEEARGGERVRERSSYRSERKTHKG